MTWTRSTHYLDGMLVESWFDDKDKSVPRATREVYRLPHDPTQLGVIRIANGGSTPRLVLEDYSTVVIHSDGEGMLKIVRLDGAEEIHPLNIETHGRTVNIEVGETMHLQATPGSDLTVYEIRYPADQNGNPEDIAAEMPNEENFIPITDHYSLRVPTGMLRKAIAFLENVFGWYLEEDRNPTWDSGQSVFMHHPTGGVYIQLTEETADVPGDPTDAFHIALATPNTTARLKRIKRWCAKNSFKLEVESVGEEKIMVKIPEVFLGAFELVPYKPSTLQNKFDHPNWI